MFLFFAVLGQKTSNNSKEDPEGKLRVNTQRKLDGDNYIIVKYLKDYEFKNGFIINGKSRDKIKAIKCGDENEEITDKETFNIAAFTPMYIYFSEPLESLVDFFSYSWNKESIYSVDLTHFDTTQLTSLSGTFYECSNLKEVNLTNFDTSTV